MPLDGKMSNRCSSEMLLTEKELLLREIADLKAANTIATQAGIFEIVIVAIKLMRVKSQC